MDMSSGATSESSLSNTTPGVVQLDFLENGLALLRLGQTDEKVVTLTIDRMNSLQSAISQIAARKPKGLVILGPHKEMFTAGADIHLIRDATEPVAAEKLARMGQEIFDAIESLPFPTVAAISGPCVGGGCELVLACKYRLMSDHKSSLIGLPEIKLGIIPGFGGTQRLPRLIGLPKALNIILAGKTIRPRQALGLGLVNEVVSFESLRERAEKIALAQIAPTPRRISLLDKFLTFTSFGRQFVKKQALTTIAKETKGFYPAPPAALDAALLGLEQGLQTGLKFEAKQLGRVIITPESKALVSIFFLTENAKALGKSARKDIEHLHAVVLGAGVMGAGIAGSLAKNECSVILKDTTEEALQRGLAQIRSSVTKLRYLSESERSFILNRIEITTRDSSNLGNANFAIEAIFEDLEVKRRVLSELSKLLPPDALIASNTSSLSISSIAAGIENPERVIGMHFFNPVEKMPLVEIVRGERTSVKSIAIVAALTTKLGKYPIVVEDVPGFLVNRILCPYLSEAAYLLVDGYSVEAIDKAAQNFGMPMGPLRLLDEVGLDVAAHVADIMQKGYGDRMKGPGHAKLLLDKGRKGKKNAAGFYDYGGKTPVPHSNLRTILGISRPPITGGNGVEITNRLILSLINEAVRCLDEGVAGRPGPEAANQINLGTVMGIGFPPFRGGILHYAQNLGARTIHQQLLTLQQTYGNRFAPTEGIRVRAEKNISFQDACV